MPPGTVLCIVCGFDQRSGRRILPAYSPAEKKRWLPELSPSVRRGLFVALPLVLVVVAATYYLLGPSRARSIPDNIKLLGSSDPKAVELATSQLTAAGRESVPALAEALNEGSDAARLNVLQVLIRLGPESKPALPKIADLLNGNAPELRLAAVNALGGIIDPDCASEKIIIALGSRILDSKEAPQTRLAAMMAAASLGPKAESLVKPLEIELLSKEPTFVTQAAETIRRIGVPRQSTLRALLGARTLVRLRVRTETAASRSQPRRETTTRQINEMGEVLSSRTFAEGPPPGAAAGVWQDPYNSITAALDELHRLAEAKNASLAQVRTALEQAKQMWIASENERTLGIEVEKIECAAPVNVLAHIVKPDPNRSPLLVVQMASLDEQDGYWYRTGAAMLLAQRGATANMAAPTLIDAMLTDDNANVVSAAKYAIETLDPKVVYPLLVDKQRHPEKWRKTGGFNDHWPDLEYLLVFFQCRETDQLVLVLSNKKAWSESSMAAAIRAAGAAGPAAEPAIPYLLEMLRHKDCRRQIDIVKSLAKIRRHGSEVVPVLLECLDRELDRTTVPSAYPKSLIDALGVFPSQAAVIAPVLSKVLMREYPSLRPPFIAPESEDPRVSTVRIAAANSLGSLGPAAKSALPSLGKAAEGRNAALAKAAAEAMRRIAPGS
jgi:hypothetical protein